MSNFVTNTSHKSRRTALLLCIFFGWLGIHRFYVRKYGTGILYMCTFGICVFGWLIDIFKIATGTFKDKWGNPLIEW